jgi:putative phosphoesterase
MKHRGAVRIGVIADTHGLYDPAIKEHFEGVTTIVHAGDIGDRAVIESLQAIAPLVAVSGNIDEYERSGFPRQIIFRRSGKSVAVRHVLYEKGKLTEEATRWLDAQQPDVCIFGHSHRPTIARYGRTLLFNPGSAGPKRFTLPRGIGLLTISRKQVLPLLIKLSDKVRRPEAKNLVNRTRQKGAKL